MRFRFLPQKTEVLECSLSGLQIMDALESKFEIPKSGKFIDKLLYPEQGSSFQRGEDLFRIDSTVKGMKQRVEIVAMGYIEEAPSRTTITIVYAAYSDYMEIFFWVWALIMAVFWVFVLLMIIGGRRESNWWIFPAVVFGFSMVPFFLREFIIGEFQAVHSKIIWTLKKL